MLSTRPDYLWAVSIITSRAFPYSLVDPSDKTSAEVLIPLADALNHEPRKKILWKYVNDTLEIITEEDIGACAQIFNHVAVYDFINMFTMLAICALCIIVGQMLMLLFRARERYARISYEI